MMRRSSLLLWPITLLLFGACLDIERTPSSATGGTGGLDSGAGAENLGGVPGFEPTPCVQACVEMTPAGRHSFALVAACTEAARQGDCANACAGPGGAVDPGGATCPVPGDVDSVPACSQCLKQSCCDELSHCFADISCITVGICASGCGG
jgi:hypothetical protein